MRNLIRNNLPKLVDHDEKRNIIPEIILTSDDEDSINSPDDHLSEKPGKEKEKIGDTPACLSSLSNNPAEINELEKSSPIPQEPPEANTKRELDRCGKKHSSVWRAIAEKPKIRTKIDENISKNNQKPTILDAQAKYRLRLCEKYVYEHNGTGLKYQIFYEGQAVDKYELPEILDPKITSPKTRSLSCRVHSRCHYSKKAEKAESHDLQSLAAKLRIHVGRVMLTYLCRSCHRVTTSYDTLVTHLYNHLIEAEKSQKTVCKRKIVKCLLMDHRKKYKLNLTDKYVYKHPSLGYEYQIYYRGEAIPKKNCTIILNLRMRDRKSGKFRCPVHKECSYAKHHSKLEIGDNFVQDLRIHMGMVCFAYLCRFCFYVTGTYKLLCRHFTNRAKQESHEMISGRQEVSSRNAENCS